MQGLILFAHGARDPRWSLPFEDILRRIRAQEPTLQVVLSYLEFMEPNLPQAGAQLAQAGCTSVDVIPLFLGAGGHVRKDLPELLACLRDQHPQMQWCLRPAIGEIDAVVQAIAQAAIACISSGPQA